MVHERSGGDRRSGGTSGLVLPVLFHLSFPGSVRRSGTRNGVRISFSRGDRGQPVPPEDRAACFVHRDLPYSPLPGDRLPHHLGHGSGDICSAILSAATSSGHPAECWSDPSALWLRPVSPCPRECSEPYRSFRCGLCRHRHSC